MPEIGKTTLETIIENGQTIGYFLDLDPNDKFIELVIAPRETIQWLREQRGGAEVQCALDTGNRKGQIWDGWITYHKGNPTQPFSRLSGPDDAQPGDPQAPVAPNASIGGRRYEIMAIVDGQLNNVRVGETYGRYVPDADGHGFTWHIGFIGEDGYIHDGFVFTKDGLFDGDGNPIGQGERGPRGPRGPMGVQGQKGAPGEDGEDADTDAIEKRLSAQDKRIDKLEARVRRMRKIIRERC